MIVAKEEDGAVSMSEIVLGAQGWVVLLYHYGGSPKLGIPLDGTKGVIWGYIWFRDGDCTSPAAKKRIKV